MYEYRVSMVDGGRMVLEMGTREKSVNFLKGGKMATNQDKDSFRISLNLEEVGFDPSADQREDLEVAMLQVAAAIWELIKENTKGKDVCFKSVVVSAEPMTESP